jgi:hypothetical protein
MVEPIDDAEPESVVAQGSRISTAAAGGSKRNRLRLDEMEAAPDEKTAAAGLQRDHPARRPVPLPALTNDSSRSVPTEAAGRWPWELALSGTAWLRPSANPKQGVGGSLTWGPVSAMLNYQPKVRHSVAAMEMLGGALGCRYDLFRTRWMVIDVGLGLDVEYQTATVVELREPPASSDLREPPPAATLGLPALPTSSVAVLSTENAWLVGPIGSLHLAVPLVLGLRGGLRIDYRWLFRTEQAVDDLPWNDGWDLGVGFFLGHAI